MIKHVWFDMGGTLFRETPAFDAVHDALRYNTYAEIVGESDLDKARQDYAALYAQFGSNSAVFSSLGKPSDYWQNLFEDIDLASVLKPDPSVNEVLNEVSSLMPISIFTNFKPHKIKSVLELLKIDPAIFTHILSGDDVEKRKPDPEGFQKILDLSALPPTEILYVGDRIDVDIKPAKARGILTCLLWQSSDEADYSAANYSDLLNVIQSQFSEN